MKCDVIASGIVNAAKQARSPPHMRLGARNAGRARGAAGRGVSVAAGAGPGPQNGRPPVGAPARHARAAAGAFPPTLVPPPTPPNPQVGINVPLVVRLEGTNVDAGKEILKGSPLKIIAADDLDDAAKKAVAALA
jgi:succinyl-CoA synthetase beta subunit